MVLNETYGLAAQPRRRVVKLIVNERARVPRIPAVAINAVQSRRWVNPRHLLLEPHVIVVKLTAPVVRRRGFPPAKTIV